MSATVQGEFRGTERFALVRRIGAGGMGVVYEAYDRERSMPVAVKTLPAVDAKALLRFKEEFRSLADMVHPNLVALHELFVDGERWFFTMELVNGVNFLEYVRPASSPQPSISTGNSEELTVLPLETLSDSSAKSGARSAFDGVMLAPGVFDLSRLEHALPQAASGLAALHAAGKLHCDIKPANVLVTGDGRVVILDFGLALSLHGQGRMARNASGGTIAYMAPEQGAGEPIGPAADSYALGVMLYEAVSGRRPFVGEPLEILRDKQTLAPAALASIEPSAPPALAALCDRLLDRRPERRPLARDLVKTGPAESATPRVETLVGRERHLTLLHEAFAKIRGGRATNVIVRGRSGMGKSTLINHFLSAIASEPNVVVIAGRCYENEFVPYNAVDSLIDALARFLQEDARAMGDAPLPTDAALLGQLFPVLNPVVSGAAPTVTPGASVQEIRRRAFAALRALLAQLGKSHPVVMHIDDLHWGDTDSAVLLSHLLRDPDPPRLLFITSYRSDAAADSACVQALQQEASFNNATVLELDALSPADAALLAAQLIAAEGQVDARAVEAIARESRGNPYFIHELVERSRATDSTTGDDRGDVTLDGVVRARINDLAPDTRRFLEVIAVSGQPLREDDAFVAAELPVRDPAVLSRLRKNHFVRTRGTKDVVAIDTYHDRIRETLLGMLTPAERAVHHRLLATTLERSRHGDAETLARHWDGAGELARARQHFVHAGDAAASTLTFDLAARLYRRALDIGIADVSQQRSVHVKLGEALANSGRNHEAANVYRAAANGADPGEAPRLLRRAAYLYCVAGHADEGRALFDELFRAERLAIPATPGAALRLYIWDSVILGVRGYKPRPPAAGLVSAAEQDRIDLVWAGATGLMEFDPITGAALQGRGLRLSLKNGEPTRVARALAFAAMTTVLTGGGPSKPRGLVLLQQARELSLRRDDPATRALISIVEGIIYWLLDRRWDAADKAFDEAEALLRTSTTGRTWELAVLHSHRVWMMYFRGRMQQAIAYSNNAIREARERGDAYLSVNLGVFAGGYARLLADDPQGAATHVDTVGATLPQSVTSIQRVMQIMMNWLIEVYDGRPTAWQSLIEHWPYLKSTYQLRSEQMRIQMLHLRARCALTTLQTAADPTPHLKEAERIAKLLAREQAAWAKAESQIIRAGVAAWNGDRANAAELLEIAARTLEALDLGQTAVPCRRQQGLLLGGDRGRALVDAADAALASQGVRSPERWSRTWVTIPASP